MKINYFEFISISDIVIDDNNFEEYWYVFSILINIFITAIHYLGKSALLLFFRDLNNDMNLLIHE
jgi:hypothetical protein